MDFRGLHVAEHQVAASHDLVVDQLLGVLSFLVALVLEVLGDVRQRNIVSREIGRLLIAEEKGG